MDHCMNSKSWRSTRIFVLVLTILLFLLFVGAGIGLLLLEEKSLLIWIGAAVMILIGCWISILYGIDFIRGGRKYCMDEEGLTVSYFPNVKKFYSWDLFSGIVVCDFNHATKNPENCQLIIRLSAVHESDGPYSKNPSRTFWGIEKWRDYEYTMANYDGIIFLGYSPELLDEVCRLSKLPVKFSLTKYGRELMDKNKADGIWDR